MTLDRQGPGSHVGVQFDVTTVSGVDGHALRTDLYGQIAFGRFGAYFGMPFSYVSGFDGLFYFLGGREGGTSAGVGNLELGGLGNFAFGPVSITTRLGLGMPTASSSNEGILSNILAANGRTTDAILATFDTLSLRTSASALVDLGLFFARADMGVDCGFHVGDSDEHGEQDTLVFLRLNAAIGANLGVVALTLEFANLGSLNTSERPFLHTMGVGLHANLWVVSAFVGYSTPLHEDGRGDVHVFHFGAKANF